jgi:hypothetical protein
MPQTGRHQHAAVIKGSQDFFAFWGLLFPRNLVELQRGGRWPAASVSVRRHQRCHHRQQLTVHGQHRRQPFMGTLRSLEHCARLTRPSHLHHHSALLRCLDPSPCTASLICRLDLSP